MSDMQKLIDEGMALCEKATPGPWEQACGRTSEAVVLPGRKCASEDLIRYNGFPIVDTDMALQDERQQEANAALIAYAGTHLRTLLTDLQSMRTLAEKLRREADAQRSECADYDRGVEMAYNDAADRIEQRLEGR